MQKFIHIISFDVPFPANYGGVIDVFYRLQQWKELGYKIILHCYEYGRGKPQELEKYCEKIYYYKREKKLLDFFSLKPFIIQTRKNKTLIKRLSQDNFPIWIEGLHCSWILDYFNKKDRKLLVRTHGIEHNYYLELSKCTTNLVKKIYYISESYKLKKYEPILKKASALYAIQDLDVSYFKKINSETYFLPSLPPVKLEDKIEVDLQNPYILYQGSLDVEENQNAVYWLIKNVLKFFPKKVIIAGKNPPEKMKVLCEKYSVKLVENPNNETMNNLLSKAKIHILYTEQSTGLKLKLINALQYHGDILLNSTMIEGTDWAKFCNVADTPEEFRKGIERLLSSPSSQNTRKRHLALKEMRMHIISILENI